MNGTELKDLIVKQTKYDDLEKIEQIFPAYQAVSTASDRIKSDVCLAGASMVHEIQWQNRDSIA